MSSTNLKNLDMGQCLLVIANSIITGSQFIMWMIVLFAVGLISLSSCGARAEQGNIGPIECTTVEVLRQVLADDYGESEVGVWTTKRNGSVILFGNHKTLTWTMTQIDPATGQLIPPPNTPWTDCMVRTGDDLAFRVWVLQSILAEEARNQ
jgi:hypothetical protein